MSTVEDQKRLDTLNNTAKKIKHESEKFLGDKWGLTRIVKLIRKTKNLNREGDFQLLTIKANNAEVSNEVCLSNIIHPGSDTGWV